jgi:prepilin-type N-terminal cleavage/methylation domain-containing protein
MKKFNSSKGFTLIELLVVIAIIAILAVVVVLTLNPAQLLAQSRDSNRVSDFATLKSAIALYQADVSSTFIGTSSILYAAYAGPSPSVVNLATTTPVGWGFVAPDAGIATATSTATSTLRGVNGVGSGWLPINFGGISSGAPFGTLPVDPLGTAVNTNCGGSCMYTYVTNTTNGNIVYKLANKMESSKYSAGGSGDVETNDGGNSVNVYEQGTNANL